MHKPLAIDLYCGLGGWAEGFLAEGWTVIGFDNEWKPYPGWFVIQDVLTLHGSQFKDASIIVGSSPCQEFSYRAMPWTRAKALPPPYQGMELFEAQFRIQREACEAAGRYIPIVVENVLGAQKWVGSAKWHYGSYYLWGDVPALMPMTFNGRKLPGNNGPRRWEDRDCQRLKDALKVSGFRFDGSGRSFRPDSVKVSGLNWSGLAKPGYVARAFNTTAEARFGWPRDSALRDCNSKSDRRKEASAMIAKIPFPLARHIARVYKPTNHQGGVHASEVFEHFGTLPSGGPIEETRIGGNSRPAE